MKARGIPTPGGRGGWYPATVARVLKAARIRHQSHVRATQRIPLFRVLRQLFPPDRSNIDLSGSLPFP